MTPLAQILPRFIVYSLLTLLLNGCSATQPISYYNLTPLPPSQPRLMATEKPLAIGIGPLQLPDALSRAHIATRIDAQSLKYSDLHRWSGSLTEDLASVLMEDIATRLPEQATVALFPWGSYFQPSHRLVLTISRFDGTPGGEVLLSARWTIANGSGKETITSRQSAIQTKVTGEEYRDLVSAQSQAVADLATEIVKAFAELNP